MLRIRLRRVGKKKQPMYRIVVADSHAPRDGAFVENIGYYHPLDNPSTIVLDEERAKHWLDKGAMPSTRVAKILKIQGVAEVSAKVATRIALGEQRKEEAKAAAKADANASGAEASASAKADADEAKADANASGAEASASAAEPEATAEEQPVEAKADAPAEADADKPAAEAETPSEGSATEADEASDDEEKSE